MQKPFSVSPMPSALHMTPSLLSAVHKIQYVINTRQGMALLLGDAGTGKTSIMRRVYSDLAAQEDITAAFIPQLQAKSLMAFVQGICSYFTYPADLAKGITGLPRRSSLQKQAQELQDFTFKESQAGRNVVLLLDEAQHLTEEMLLALRGFLNYESNTAKYLQIILAGQLELRVTLKDMKSIRRRIVMNSMLDSLTIRDMQAMLEHRCKVFELSPFPFDDDAIRALYDATGGIPGETLKLCAASFELAQMQGLSHVTADLIKSIAYHEGMVIDGESN